ncbi:MAG: diaminopimelate epimerase [Bacteroidales bacterium]
MQLAFEKYQGTGNDFILTDGRATEVIPGEEQIKFLCDRHFGIGADGFMILLPHGKHAFGMKYYNADGRESTMCGNGGRCMIEYARSLGLFGKQGTFLATDGIHQGRILDNGMISLKMNDVVRVEPCLNGYYLDTGSPHYVEFVTDVSRLNVTEAGQKIRHHEAFKPAGTNVNFAEIMGPGKLYVRTFERGVEAETLSCGTGVTASAISSVFYTGHRNRNFTIETRGGRLKISFSVNREGIFQNVWLTGPAIHVFSGTITV